MNAANAIFVGSYGRGMWKMDLSQAHIFDTTKDLSSKSDQIIKNSPNPVVNRTNIRFRVKDNQTILAGIYDLAGRLVKIVYQENAVANRLQTVIWDATNRNGVKAASGNYICRLIGEKVTLARMITVKR